MGDNFLQFMKIRALEDRIVELEKKVFKKEKNLKVNRSQKMLLLHELGVLDLLQSKEEDNTKSRLATLISLLCDIDFDNVRKDLSTLGTPKSEIASPENYKVVIEVLKRCGFKAEAERVEEISYKNHP